jgi:hypothetical protein
VTKQFTWLQVGDRREKESYRRMTMVKFGSLVLAGAVGLVIGGALAYGPLLQYRSEGVLSLEMGTAEYKRFSELASDPKALRQFATTVPPIGMKSADTETLSRQLGKITWHQPVPKISRADGKDLPDIVMQMQQERERERERDRQDDNRFARTYLGVRLSYAMPDPQQAAAVTNWLGSYFREVALRESIREQLVRWKAENQLVSDRSQARKLQHEFEIEQARARVDSLKKVLAAYPDAARREGTQVVELRKDNEKFMSPLSQLVASESEIIAGREQIKRLERDLEQQRFVKDLLVRFERTFQQASSGSEAAERVSTLITEHVKEIKTDAEREKLAFLASDLSQISTRFLAQAQFIAPPSAPMEPVRSPTQIMAIGMLLGTFVASVWLWRAALLKILEPKPSAKGED